MKGYGSIEKEESANADSKLELDEKDDLVVEEQSTTDYIPFDQQICS